MMMFTQMKMMKAHFAKRGFRLRAFVVSDNCLEGWFHVVETAYGISILCNTKDFDHYRGKIEVEDLPAKMPELFDTPLFINDTKRFIQHAVGKYTSVRIDKSAPPF